MPLHDVMHGHTSVQYPPPDRNGADQITTVLFGRAKLLQPLGRQRAKKETKNHVSIKEKELLGPQLKTSEQQRIHSPCRLVTCW